MSIYFYSHLDIENNPEHDSRDSTLVKDAARKDKHVIVGKLCIFLRIVFNINHIISIFNEWVNALPFCLFSPTNIGIR
jgi:hypothetical protein